MNTFKASATKDAAFTLPDGHRTRLVIIPNICTSMSYHLPSQAGALQNGIGWPSVMFILRQVCGRRPHFRTSPGRDTHLQAELALADSASGMYSKSSTLPTAQGVARYKASGVSARYRVQTMPTKLGRGDEACGLELQV